MQVLVVDDEFIIATDTAETLIEAGHDVAGPVCTVEEAMRIAETHKPDLALIDVNLHGRQEGPALARALGERWGIPCLFVTAQPALAREHRSAAVGVLAKPFAGRDLVASVAHAGPHGPDEPRTWRPRNLEMFDDDAGPTAEPPVRAVA